MAPRSIEVLYQIVESSIATEPVASRSIGRSCRDGLKRRRNIGLDDFLRRFSTGNPSPARVQRGNVGCPQ